MIELAWIAGALGLVALTVWTQRRGPLLQYLYFCRFGLLAALALAVFPPVATRTVAATLFANLYWLDGRGIYLVTWLALLASWMVMVAVEVVLLNAPLRFNVSVVRSPPWLHRWRVPVYALLALPTVATAVAMSPGGPGAKVLAVARGAGTALLCLLGAGLLHVLLLPLGAPGEDLLVPGLGRLLARIRRTSAPGPLPRSLRPEAYDTEEVPGRRRSPLDGYVERRTGYLRPGHLVALTLLAVALAAYLYHGWRGPFPEPWPALAYLLLVLILAGWGLSGAAFLLDRYRVPVLSVLLLLSAVTSQVSDTDHYFGLAPGPAPGAAPPDVPPARAFEAADAKGPQGPVVVVAASGGGITTAVWTAQVLTGLQRSLGPGFSRSIRLISAVSGGGVGTLYYLDRFEEGRPPAAAELPGIVEAAGRSSLDAAAWGIAYPDLWRVFSGFLLRDKTRDRGWAMERSWMENLRHPEATLSDWGREAGAGRLPPVVFNATVVETGEQFLLTSLEPPAFWPARRFGREYPGRDLAVARAARLSATFPWVSPVSRARDDGVGRGRSPIPGYHLADGGYFDNSGVVTAVAWLRSLLPTQLDELRRRKVLLVIVRAFPEGGGYAAKAGKGRSREGWVFATGGPVLTMYNVRNSSQSFRNGLELDLLRDAWQKGYGIDLRPVVFELPERAPLSWKLTDEQRERIRAGWGEASNQASLASVRQLFGRGKKNTD